MSLPSNTDKKDRHIVQRVFQALDHSKVYAILDRSIDNLLMSNGSGSVPAIIKVRKRGAIFRDSLYFLTVCVNVCARNTVLHLGPH